MKIIFSKKIVLIYFIFSLVFALLYLSCSKTASSSQTNPDGSNPKTPQLPYTITITAIVYFQTIDNQQQLILIENPESKSRKSYECINLSDDMRNKLLPLSNKKIVAEIRILKEVSPWYMKAELLSFYN